MSDELCVINPENHSYYRKLGANIQLFQSKIAAGFNNFPSQLIDPTVMADAVLHYDKPDDMPDDLVASAGMLVEYQDGIPCIEGVPVWERLDGERLEFYKYFKTYAELKEECGFRSISLLSSKIGVLGKYLNTLSKVYHWAIRCKAYDMFQDTLRARKKVLSVRKLEEKHASAADFLLDGAVDYLKEHPDQLNPKIAVQMIQTAVKVGRLAVGLSADGNSKGNTTTNVSVSTSNTSAEVNNTTNNVVAAAQTTNLEELQSILHILDKSGAFEAEALGVSTGVSTDVDVVDITATEATE